MRSGYLVITAVLVPLPAIIVLAAIGITYSAWVYVILAVACPAAAVVLWYGYRNTEKKLEAAGKKGGEPKA